MDENTIKAGDVVRLKSDGPLMTVEYVTESTSYGRLLNCVWFNLGNPTDLVLTKSAFYECTVNKIK